MTEPIEKKKSGKATVRINREGGETEEVFITCDDPYVNKVIYTKPGVFKEGEFLLSELDKKEEAAKKAEASPSGEVAG